MEFATNFQILFEFNKKASVLLLGERKTFGQKTKDGYGIATLSRMEN